MNHRSTESPRSLLPGLALLLLAAVALTAASPASAGIGNPLKKAKEKLAKMAAPDPAAPVGDDTVVFDEAVLELTDERVARVVRAFNAAKSAAAGRAAHVEILNKTTDERGNLWEKHSEAIMELERKRGDMDTCYRDGYHEAQEQLTAEYSQKVLTDPAIREKFARAAMENNAAAAKGDSTAIAKINAVLMSETIISAADSAAVRKKCGAMPPITPNEVKLEELDKKIASENEQIRDIDKKVSDDQAKELQMDREQFGNAMDRIAAYRAWKRAATSGSKSPPILRGFTQEEIDALEKHFEELEGALG